MQYVKCLVCFFLVAQSDESSNNISDKSSDDNEDKESKEIWMYFRSVWTRSCSFACSIAALHIGGIQELVAPCSYKRPFKLVTFVLLLLLVISQFVCLLSKLILYVEYLLIFPEFLSLHHYDAIRL